MTARFRSSMIMPPPVETTWWRERATVFNVSRSIRPKFLLAMPREDVLDGHPLRRDNQVVGIDELPAEQSRDLMPGRRLAGPGEACDEYVFSAQWCAPTIRTLNRQVIV